MKQDTIQFYIYPLGIADSLGQDDFVLVRNKLGSLDTKFVSDLVEGDYYCKRIPKPLPFIESRTAPVSKAVLAPESGKVSDIRRDLLQSLLLLSWSASVLQIQIERSTYLLYRLSLPKRRVDSLYHQRLQCHESLVDVRFLYLFL